MVSVYDKTGKITISVQNKKIDTYIILTCTKYKEVVK